MDFVPFSIVAFIAGVGAFTPQSAVVRAGGVLLALWAVIGLYSVRRFHGLTAALSTEANASTCVAWYQRQLVRQRDVALSRPWGIALALPGLGLLSDRVSRTRCALDCFGHPRWRGSFSRRGGHHSWQDSGGKMPAGDRLASEPETRPMSDNGIGPDRAPPVIGLCCRRTGLVDRL